MTDDPDPTELDATYRPRLVAELAELRDLSQAASGSRATVQLDQQSVGRLSRMDALQGQAMAAGVEARRQGRARAITAAMGRLDEGEFGFCEDCGGFIGHKRLSVDPCAMRCVECAR